MVMLEEANNFLACPKCKSSLTMMSNEKKGNEIITGSLQCQNASCKKIFEIENGIPNFLI
tara:strand:- start:9919 stop:10098 length:180 start_codon:yes stop_codon:yes gene_type:complete